MYVVATAGHVDHGKSTLVKALTGMEPDRWEEERQRGLTIDLGFVWTTLPAGEGVAFVDVPGHERFLGNMLAGVGPAPAVMFVVAADEGWQEQSADHRDALAAFGIDTGVIVLSRADKADDARIAEVREQVRREFLGTGLAEAPIVVVSAKTGAGLEVLRSTLEEVLSALPRPEEAKNQRLRLWIDRSFHIKGAGCVVTGTLTTGQVIEDEKLLLYLKNKELEVSVRGIQSGNVQQVSAEPYSRVAINLRGVNHEDIHRGDILVKPGAWIFSSQIDVRLSTGTPLDQIPDHVVAHMGTAAAEATVRPLGADHARLTLSRALPLKLGDRFVLRAPGGHEVVAGVVVADLTPPPFERRGAGKRRATELETLDIYDPKVEILRRGAVTREDLTMLGYPVQALEQLETTGEIIVFPQGWFVSEQQLAAWVEMLKQRLAAAQAKDPLVRGISTSILNSIPAPLRSVVVERAQLVVADGIISQGNVRVDLGAAEESIATVEEWLAKEPFNTPDADELKELALGPKQLAAAERAHRILRITDEIILLPSAIDIALSVLRGIEQPFSLSEARKALDTTRRVAVPLLEYLDLKKKTRRVDGNLRVVL